MSKETLSPSEEYKSLMAENQAMEARMRENKERMNAILEAQLINDEKEEVNPISTPNTVKEYNEPKVTYDRLPDEEHMDINTELQELAKAIGSKRAKEIENAISMEMHRGNSARYKVRNVNGNEMVIAFSYILKVTKNDLEQDYAVAYADSIGVNIDGLVDLENEGNFVDVSNSALYKKDISVSLTLEEQKELFIRLDEIKDKEEYDKERKEIVDKLVRRNWPLALYVASKHTYIPFDSHQERQQAAMLGLTKAINTYNYRLSKFSTYAYVVMRRTMQRESAIEQDYGLPINGYVQNSIHKLKRVEEELTDLYGRPPRDEELADTLTISEYRVRELKKLAGFIEERESFDAIYEGIEERANVVEEVSYESAEPEYDDVNFRDRNFQINDEDILDATGFNEDQTSDKANTNIFKDCLEEALSTLTSREEQVLRLRFGLGTDMPPMDLESVGKRYRVSRERVRQIEAKALRKLRHPSRSRKLRDFVHD